MAESRQTTNIQQDCVIFYACDDMLKICDKLVYTFILLITGYLMTISNHTIFMHSQLNDNECNCKKDDTAFKSSPFLCFEPVPFCILLFISVIVIWSLH